MYTNINLEVIQDTAPYKSLDGTSYPRNYPKDEIAGLFLVTETPKPTDLDIIVEGFTIDETYTQVWNTRPKTAEENQADDENHNAMLDAEMMQADMKIIRALIDGDADRINQHKTAQTNRRNLKKQIK